MAVGSLDFVYKATIVDLNRYIKLDKDRFIAAMCDYKAGKTKTTHLRAAYEIEEKKEKSLLL